MRPKKPPRPKSEVFLNKQDPHPRRKRFSAFGVSMKITKKISLIVSNVSTKGVVRKLSSVCIKIRSHMLNVFR